MGSDTSLSARIARSNLLRYLLAVCALLVAALVCTGVNRLVGDRFAYVLLLPAVAFSAWYCGIGPSVLTSALAIVGEIYGFQPTAHPFHRPAMHDVIGSLSFVLCAALIALMGEWRREENTRLWRAQDELELRVRQRTADLDVVNHNLRELSARLMQLQDEERRRIARELHDSVGQTLAALSMNLSTVRADMERLASAIVALNDSESLVRDMVTEVRTISHLLHPPLLDELGLSSALRWYVDGFVQRSRIKVDLDMPEDFGRLPAELETAIFRVVQESLTNIHRHSGSSVAKIRLRQRENQVQVEIEDKGKGIPTSKLQEMASAGTPGVGIRGMQERIRQLGGTLEINSGSAGTLVRVLLPIPEASTVEALQPKDSSAEAAA
ncbi:MAG TPA: sensor histidine kinase [Candidatus Sulfotelmatobacter sp.]|nr:sensor histidine kinase [Candidatus Sulfotelmatobacter sp.]